MSARLEHFCSRCNAPLTAAAVEIDRIDPMGSPAMRDLLGPPPDQVPTLEQTMTAPGGPVPRLPMAPPAPMSRPGPPPPRPTAMRPPVAPPRPMPYVAPVPYGYVPLRPVYAPLKSKAGAALLAWFFGFTGAHRFYLGDTGLGVAMLVLFFAGFVTLGLTWLVVGIWAFVDFVLILAGAVRDAHGRPLT